MAVTTTPFGDPTTDILDLALPQNFLQQDVGRYVREIADLPVPHVVIEEDHDDELIITQHPVEFGAIISDHAYKKPSEVRIRCAWNNSGSHYPLHGSAYTQKPVVLSGYEGYARAVYDQILALQISRKPFSVVTGKRIYKDMLVANIRVHTAPGSEYSLMADIVLREVILVSTKTLTLDVESSRMRDTAPPLNQGKKEAAETPNVGEQARIAAGGSDLGFTPAPSGDA
jgi:hypothetical protein